MWLKSLFLLCCTVALALSEDAKHTPEYVSIRSTPEAVRVAPSSDFVTSHKLPEGIPYPSDDAEDPSDAPTRAQQKQEVIQRIQKLDSKLQPLKPVSQSLDPLNPLNSPNDSTNTNSKRQARVQLETFSSTGFIPEESLKLSSGFRRHDQDFDEEDEEPLKTAHKYRPNPRDDDHLSGVQVSAEYPTTMRPILTTERQQYSRASFDFVPVNIIREDSKDNWTPFANRNFDDLGDVSLVPAGSNSRIQIKKGPNGKDYEYEYVYYYYDEEEEGKAGAASSNQEGIRTTPSSSPSSRRSGSSGRSKYSSVDRSTTAEPVSNEVLPNRVGNRGRNLENEEVNEERLPTNTRFPPRSRSNHNTGTTEPSRNRGNRPRPNLDLVDSSSFRTHQEGPEFPQTLPKGPVRFLGVTPNESGDGGRTRGRPHRVQEPAPVAEREEEDRKRPAAEPALEVELNRGQPSRPPPAEDEETSTFSALREDKLGEEKILETTTLDTPTTEYPSAMDKVALDLYAFLQQGQSNLVDSATDAEDSNENTTLVDDDSTTNLPTTTDGNPTTIEAITTTEATTTSTTTTTTTTEAPTTPVLPGRGKFRRPGVPGGAGNRNRFKSSGSSTTTENPSPAEPTQRRNRFGANSGGFKRPRPGSKAPAQEEEVRKDSASSVNAEKPANGRNRYRGNGSKPAVSTTPAPATPSSSSSSSSSGVPRPTFNKINLNRRRGRPTTPPPSANEENQEAGETGGTEGSSEASTTTKSPLRPRLPGVGPRPVRPGAKINLRRPGQPTTTTATPEVQEGTLDEPAGEGTEEETHETPAETVPPTKHTTLNPLNKLRNRNRLQVHPKTTTRSPLPTAPRKSPLLPRRRTTEAPVVESTHEEAATEGNPAPEETEVTEGALPETSTAASSKHEEVRARTGLLAPRRRIAPRRPGQIIGRE
ncbi:mucin-5AC [Diachasma alloeum]|uniref:mucin-5AC n=1 Tax=Diachasma alloeum TaxID=454923 RepID=UPI0007384CED|nr:mucin-5AC [Diachasma alloeum]